MILEIAAAAFLTSTVAVYIKNHKTSKLVAEVSSRLTSVELQLESDSKRAEEVVKTDVSRIVADVKTEAAKVL